MNAANLFLLQPGKPSSPFSSPKLLYNYLLVEYFLHASDKMPLTWVGLDPFQPNRDGWVEFSPPNVKKKKRKNREMPGLLGRS